MVRSTNILQLHTIQLRHGHILGWNETVYVLNNLTAVFLSFPVQGGDHHCSPLQQAPQTMGDILGYARSEDWAMSAAKSGLEEGQMLWCFFAVIAIWTDDGSPGTQCGVGKPPAAENGQCMAAPPLCLAACFEDKVMIRITECVWFCCYNRNCRALLGVRACRRNTALSNTAAYIDFEERTPGTDVVLRQHADRSHHKPFLKRHRRRRLTVAAQFALVGRLCT